MNASFPQQRLLFTGSRYFVLKSREKPQDLEGEKKQKKEHEKVLTNDSGWCYITQAPREFPNVFSTDKQRFFNSKENEKVVDKGETLC